MACKVSHLLRFSLSDNQESKTASNHAIVTTYFCKKEKKNSLKTIKKVTKSHKDIRTVRILKYYLFSAPQRAEFNKSYNLIGYWSGQNFLIQTLHRGYLLC